MKQMTIISKITGERRRLDDDGYMYTKIDGIYGFLTVTIAKNIVLFVSDGNGSIDAIELDHQYELEEAPEEP